MPVERFLEPGVEDQAERHLERADERDGRRERGVELRLRLQDPAPVEVEAASLVLERRGLGRRGHAHEGESRRRHERLLRARHDRVELPLVGRERHGAEARDRIVLVERARNAGVTRIVSVGMYTHDVY